MNAIAGTRTWRRFWRRPLQNWNIFIHGSSEKRAHRDHICMPTFSAFMATVVSDSKLSMTNKVVPELEEFLMTMVWWIEPLCRRWFQSEIYYDDGCSEFRIRTIMKTIVPELEHLLVSKLERYLTTHMVPESEEFDKGNTRIRIFLISTCALLPATEIIHGSGRTFINGNVTVMELELSCRRWFHK